MSCVPSARSLALLGTGLASPGWILPGCGPLIEPLAARCGGAVAAVGDLQGPGSSSPRQHERATVEGVITLVAASAELPGFFLQSERSDADPLSSEGLFVRAAEDALGSLAPGQRVRVRGRVAELEGSTALAELELLEPCGSAALEPTRVSLNGAEDVERWESMLVHSAETWTLIDTAELESSGRVRISAQGRSYAPGHPLGQTPPAQWALAGLGERLGEWLEAGTESEHLRLGARATGLSVLVGSASPPLLLDAGSVTFRAEPAPAPPRRPADTLRVAALNLDNYFGSPGSRGARSQRELERQRTKLVALLQQLDADVLALSEVGDPSATDGAPGSSASASLAELLAGVDAASPGEPPYRVSDSTGSPGGSLRAAIAYRSRQLEPAGEAWFASDDAFRRAPLLQRFHGAGGSFTLAVVHLKSKLCSGAAEIVGPEGCGAAQRLAEARGLLRVLSALPGPEADEALVIGDFNADALEAPLRELRAGGLTDLLAGMPATERYSYVFEGKAAQLDHALAGQALARRLRAANIWHINADEPALLGYELEHAAQAYTPDARRSSDHDPILIDLSPRAP